MTRLFVYSLLGRADGNDVLLRFIIDVAWHRLREGGLKKGADGEWKAIAHDWQRMCGGSAFEDKNTDAKVCGRIVSLSWVFMHTPSALVQRHTLSHTAQTS